MQKKIGKSLNFQRKRRKEQEKSCFLQDGGSAGFIFEDLFGFSVFRGENIFEKEIDKPRKK